MCNYFKTCMCITIQVPIFSCTANIIMYNITVMDHYNSSNIVVSADMSSVEISEFPDNRASIVANREYNITVSAISDEGTNYPSDPIVVSKLSCSYVCTVCTLCSVPCVVYLCMWCIRI